MLAAAKGAPPESDRTASLLSGWAAWDPKPGLAAAIATNDAGTISEAAEAAAYGPWSGEPSNTSHHGLGIVKEFNPATLPEPVRDKIVGEFGIQIMELWGDIDIGEAARWSYDHLIRNHYAPRENLIALFSGDDRFSSDSDMIDRAFCALRVWAVVRPAEMKAWIATIDDPTGPE